MIPAILEKKEKKVEYVELIYDLIFVYIIGRNNALLHHVQNGFVELSVFFAYVLCTLAVIQIWTLTTYYINMYGRNSARDYIFMFINMFLMYFIGVGTRHDWHDYHTMYHIAWALILANIAAQYLIELRNHRGDPVHLKRITRMAVILLIEAALAACVIFEYNTWGTTVLTPAAILFGIVTITFTGSRSHAEIVDFEHLSERVMLYVVFTFGEMIIAVAGYFDEDITLNTLYFALMCFAIVVGLFLSYGVIYDRIVDRGMCTNGLGYTLIHIFIIFALNNITVALEFMRSEEVELLPKLLMLIGSLVLYYVFLFMTGIYAKQRCHLRAGFFLSTVGLGAGFVLLMLLFRENMQVNIAVTVVFVFAVYLILYVNSKRMNVPDTHSLTSV